MEHERYNYSTGVHWEPLRGYSRAVRVDNHLYVSGTTAMLQNGEVVALGDPYEQTRFVINTLRRIVSKAGFLLTDVVRTRLFVTNIAKWEDYARAHSEAFDKIRPASSMVQVMKLADPRLLVEMEADLFKGCRLVETIMLNSSDLA